MISRARWQAVCPEVMLPSCFTRWAAPFHGVCPIGHLMPDLLGTYSLVVLANNVCSGASEIQKAFGDCLLRNMTKGRDGKGIRKSLQFW